MSLVPFCNIEEAVVWCGLLDRQVVYMIVTGHAGSEVPLDFHLPTTPGTNACALMRWQFIQEIRRRDLIEINALAV